MEKSFSITPWKYALFTSCVLIVVCNLLFLSCGVVTWGSATSVTGGYATALCGVCIFSAAFLGVYVALKESYKYSIYYLIGSGFVLIMLVVYFCTFTSMKSQLLQQFDERLKRLFEEKTHHDDTMRPIHSLFACCGLDGPQDYLAEQHGALPASCCYSFDCTVEANVYSEGCATKASRHVHLQAEINHYMTMVIFVLQILGLVTAYYMGKARKMSKLKDDEAPINED